MTIDEAIKRNEAYLERQSSRMMLADIYAQRLGIEALMFIRDHRRPHTATSLPILPGEAEEVK